MMRKPCPLCSQLSSKLKRLLLRLIGGNNNCNELLKRVEKETNRVNAFNSVAPLSCACENKRMSKFSPKPVDINEVLARFIFSPMHIGKNQQLKPSVFSHVFDKGCSIQREDIADNNEITRFLQTFLNNRDDFRWIGVLTGTAQDVRSIGIGNTGNRAVCVYDTAEKANTAHAEIFQTQYVIEDADKVELRANLFQAFGSGLIHNPDKYRSGNVWMSLPQALRDRK